MLSNFSTLAQRRHKKGNEFLRAHNKNSATNLSNRYYVYLFVSIRLLRSNDIRNGIKRSEFHFQEDFHSFRVVIV